MLKIDDYLTVKEAADFLGVNPNTMRNWGKTKKLSAFRHPFNGHRMYRKEDLESILSLIARKEHEE